MPTIEDTIDGVTTRRRIHITTAEIVALGAVTAGNIDLGVVLPIGAKMTRVRASNAGAIVTGLATLTVSVGDTAAPEEQLAAATVFASGAVAETDPVTPFAAQTATVSLIARFTGDANLDTMTGAEGGFDILLEWSEIGF